MNTQVTSIISNLRETLDGVPWHGKSAYDILGEINPRITNLRPGTHPHSAIDLIYHMLTWTDFTLKRVLGEKINDMEQFKNSTGARSIHRSMAGKKL